jgi:hypothetical protein
MMLSCQTNIIKCSAAASKESDYVFADFSSQTQRGHATKSGLTLASLIKTLIMCRLRVKGEKFILILQKD